MAGCWRMTDAGEFERVAQIDELPDRGFVRVAVGEHSVLVAKLDDGVYATENQCSHANSALEDGRFRLGRISCPLHGLIFDFRTGQVMGGSLTLVGLRTFDTRVDDGQVYVRREPNEPRVGIMKR
ncbi:MAG: Rieske 2Fe-2S domain-containing protein [Pseudomonadales bacterium]